MRYLLLLLGLLLGSGVHASEARARLDAFLDGLNTLAASFEQSILDTENSRAGRFQGQFYLKRPGRFRWDYKEPQQKVILADGDYLWMQDKELEQVTRHFQSQALKGTPAEVLLTTGKIEDKFEVADIGQSRGMLWLELIPRDEDSQFVRILLAFSGPELRRMEMSDKFGQITRFQFYNIQRNPDLPDKLFEFDTPAGYDLLDQASQW